jgi:hypothetical protein
MSIFCFEAAKNACRANGKAGRELSVCKEALLIKTPAREKLKYLSDYQLLVM